jgi:predicted dithiol-disulfide oxidoreductase (DUF899 family)
MEMATKAAVGHKVVSQEEWLKARVEHLKSEKVFTRMRDELSRARRELPWVKVEKEYLFDGPNGKETLAQLFGPRTQLFAYHFMLGPGWSEGCRGCSYVADHFDGATIHLENRDLTLVAISRAPIEEIEAFKKRMGWKFKWVSSNGSGFNHDFHVSFTPEEMAAGQMYYNFGMRKFPVEEAQGASVFSKDEDGNVYHTYSTYARGLDMVLGTYHFLDMAPRGRGEDELAFAMSWVRHHDRYGDGYVVNQGDTYVPEEGAKTARA